MQLQGSRISPLLLAMALIIVPGPGYPQNTMPSRYEPLTREERARWFVRSSIGPTSILTVMSSAAIDTARNSPEEFGTHWEGYARRMGYRFGDRLLTNGMEAGLGSLWNEDPRYFRVPEKPVSGRIKNVLKMTVTTHNREGREMPAYARFIAVPSAAFLSNTWKPDSEDDRSDAVNRVVVSFVNRIAANAFTEFWPDLRRKTLLRDRKKSDPDSVDKYAAALSR